MIEIAYRRITDGKFMVKDICDVKFNTGFDCVICGFAIPYLDFHETTHVMKTISQSLSDNGCFYLSFMEGTKNNPLLRMRSFLSIIIPKNRF